MKATTTKDTRPVTLSAPVPNAFSRPDPAFRGFPLWSWNGRLDEQRLDEQLAAFADMGFGGAMPHVRLGLQDAYLGERFLDCIAHARATAERLGLLLPLYDEDQWPSGHAGGLVTRDPSFRQKECIFLPDGQTPEPGGEEVGLSGPATLLARWAFRRTSDGSLARWRRLGAGEQPHADEEGWAAWTRTVRRSWDLGSFTRVDALMPAAMERFVAITHERYRQRVGPHFGKQVPFIFSDEPQIGHHGRPAHHRATTGSGPSDLGANRLALPWTVDLPETWTAAFGTDLLDLLPAIFWDSADATSARARWCWFDHLGQRFAATWTGIPTAWGEQHGLPLCGHMCCENDLTNQSLIDADVMRALAPMQYPASDLLCDLYEPNAVKQAVSVARQGGRDRVATELYGVNRWDWPLVAHRRQGDWQYALGINMRVLHLAWYSMAGAAKRDFPQPIDLHAPWAPAYRRIEDHFARLGSVLSQGHPVVDVAVVHPLESAWIELGPQAEHAAVLHLREQRFAELADWLIDSLIDFDYVAESLLPQQMGEASDGRLAVGAMRYALIILPDLRTVRRSTLEACARLLAAGGRVLVLGEAPTLLEGSATAPQLDPACERLPWDRAGLLEALAPLRRVRVPEADSGAFPYLVHQLRTVDDRQVLFVCNRSNEHASSALCSTVRVRGAWQAELLGTEDGSGTPQPTGQADGWTILHLDLPVNGSRLWWLRPAVAAATALPPPPPSPWNRVVRCEEPQTTALSEPNVLVLDHGCYALDGGTWTATDDLLMLDEDLRRSLGLPSAEAQPWLLPPEKPRHRISVRFAIQSAVPATGLRLMCEQQPRGLRLDGHSVTIAADGWWVDRDLRCWHLPDLAAGAHQVELDLAFGTHARLEWCYLLGGFGVQVAGAHAAIIAPPTTLVWGDLGQQGLPFYAGNVDYQVAFAHDGGPLAVQVPRFAGAAVGVAIDGRDCGIILEANERLACGELGIGTHLLRLRWYGTRTNAFAPLHNADPQHRMEVPHSWVTRNAAFSRSYRLGAQGILDAPLVWSNSSTVEAPA